MAKLPLPEFNTGIGFYYFPDDLHYRPADAQAWIPELKALGASWLTLRSTAARAVPESFLRAVIDSGIEPILHIPNPPGRPIDLDELRPLCSSYARWGVHYVVLYDRPNVRLNWPAEDWARAGLVDRFLDRLLPALTLVHSSGLVPVFPPLKQGGDYWDTSFLDTAIHSLRVRGQSGLLDELVFSCYAFAGNRPADWGAGGSARWTQTRPYHVPPGSQDQRGFRAFEWYNEVIASRLGAPRPLLMIAGGACLGDADDAGFLKVDEDRHTSCNMDIMDAMLNRRLPAYMINVAYYLLSAAPDDAQRTLAWYRAEGAAVPAVAAMKQKMAEAIQALAASEKRPAPSTAAPGSPCAGKTIYHYLLLPTFEWGVSSWHWEAAVEYIRKFQPTCGFSPAEASSAEHVTIVGNEQGIGPAIENDLRSAGCKVDRVSGQDGAETQIRLNEMARMGRRFLAYP
jgi:hypothetical protein